MKSKNIEYIEKIDHLRAFSALIVFFFEFHKFNSFLPEPKIKLAIIEHGQIGVCLFMVISGFLLAQIVGLNDVCWKKFYLNRIIRIYPLLVFIVSLGYFSRPDPRETQVGIDFILALLPISNLYRLHFGQFGGMFWSVAVELQFYFLFPLIWNRVKKNGLSSIFILILFLIFIRSVIFFSTRAIYDFEYFSIFGSLDAFIFGILAKLLNDRFSFKTRDLLFVPLILLIYLIARGEEISSNESPLWIIWPTILPVSFLILLVLYLNSGCEIFGSKFFAFVGRISYAIYATQYLTFTAIRDIILKFSTFDPYLLAFMTLFIFIIPVATIIHYTVERPFLDLRTKYLK